MKKNFLLVLTLLVGLVAESAMAFVPNNDFIFLFNRLPGQPLARKYSLGTELSESHTRAICVFDGSYTGASAVGQVALRNTDGLTTCVLPAKSVIFNVMVDVTTAVTATGSASVAVQTAAGAGSSSNLVTTTAKASLGANVRILGTPVFGTSSTWIKNGATDTTVQANITGAGVSAGHFRVFIDYGRSE